MKIRNLSSFCCAISLLASSAPAALGAQPEASLKILTAVDYPGSGNSTLPEKINERGEIAGYFIDSNATTFGFMRSRLGSFSAPITDPNDTGNFTELRGINNAGLTCGYYLDTDYHGFFLSGNSFTQFDVPDALSTFLLSVNDNGNFCGDFDSVTGVRTSYVSIGGTLAYFEVPGATINNALGMNNANEIVGDYVDSESVTHGYFRDASGTLTYPLDFPGATSTILFGINDEGVIVGRYVDSAGATHGLILRLPGSFASFDYPGATFTSLNGITNRRIICGRYQDDSGLFHGFIARVQ